jgi:hypothetical protein
MDIMEALNVIFGPILFPKRNVKLLDDKIEQTF